MVVLNNLIYLPGRLSQFLAVLSGALSILSDGMQFGWTSPVSSILLSPTSPIPTTKENIMSLETIYMIGGIWAIPYTIYSINKIGRKNTILVAALENLVAWILIATSSSIVSLSIARFIAGLTVNVDSATTSMYTSEISDKNTRGRLTSIIYIMMLAGIVIIYAAGSYNSITNSALIGASIVTFQIITFSFMPESPYYHLIKNQKKEARKSLQIFRSTLDVEEELNNIEETMNKEKAERGNILDLFRIKRNLKSIIIVTVLVSSQHFAGSSVMYMNIHMISEESKSSLKENVVANIFATVALVSCLFAGFLIDKLGRKVLLCMSSFFTGISLFTLAFYFTVKTRGTNLTNFTWLPIVCVVIYGFALQSGIGFVPFVLAAEIFPTNLKAYGITYGNLVYALAGLLSLYIFSTMQSNFGVAAPLYLFSGCCMFTCLFTFLFVSETKGKSLDEIQSLLRGETSASVVADENKRNECNYSTG